MAKSGIVFLIPNVLAENTEQQVLSPQIKEAIEATDYFMVEDARSARRFIASLKTGKQIGDLHFYIVDKDTPKEKVKSYFKEIPDEVNIGIISQAGCPGIADPGALVVEQAHLLGIQVKPLVGPSSILLALMSSGFNGQSFTFHGYLPIEAAPRSKFIHQMEQEVIKSRRTQIFMETPYRNNQLLKDILATCHQETLLCIACNISSTKEFIKTMKIKNWKAAVPDLHKQPTIFLLYS